MTSTAALRGRSAEADARLTLEARILTWLMIGLVVWLPLQTPIAIALYQYTDLSPGVVRALVLAKDVVVAGLIVVLAWHHLGAIRWYWFDLAAIVFVAMLGLYALMPLVGQAPPSLNATIAGLRQFALPIEIYALGRLAAAAGVRTGSVLRAFLGVALVSAAVTAGLWLFAPPSFWTSTLDLVSYVHDVQGLPYAKSLWDISVVGNYGQQDGREIFRAIGPFTHPVGAGAYFVLPFALAVAAAFAGRGAARSRVVWVIASVVCFAAILFTISRGSWLAAILALVVAGLVLRRLLVAIAFVIAIGLVIWFVPPFSISVHSALNGTDGSAIMHQQAIEDGVRTVGENPLGLGVGRSDVVFGRSFGGASEGALLENTYLAVFVASGPVGLVTFAAWLAGVAFTLWPRADSLRWHWPGVAIVAALGGLLVASLTSATLLRFTTGASFWLLLGIMVGHAPAAQANLRSLRSRLPPLLGRRPG